MQTSAPELGRELCFSLSSGGGGISNWKQHKVLTMDKVWGDDDICECCGRRALL